MSKFYIDPIERRRIATRWVEITLFSLHAWGTLVVLSGIVSGTNTSVHATMFSTICTGIGLTLLILICGNAADVLVDKFTSHVGAPKVVTETSTHSVITEPVKKGAKTEDDDAQS